MFGFPIGFLQDGKIIFSMKNHEKTDNQVIEFIIGRVQEDVKILHSRQKNYERGLETRPLEVSNETSCCVFQTMVLLIYKLKM